MEIKVRNVDFNYDVDGIVSLIILRFDSRDLDGTSFNGAVRITEEEYNLNATNLQALSDLALTKLKAKINA